MDTSRRTFILGLGAVAAAVSLPQIPAKELTIADVVTADIFKPYTQGKYASDHDWDARPLGPWTGGVHWDERPRYLNCRCIIGTPLIEEVERG
jgi:hypothetical protein